MKVLMFREWDNPKDETRRKEYAEISTDTSYAEKMKDVKFKRLGSWTDNTGHIISLYEFENMEELAKIWNDVEFHQNQVRFWRSVDNFKIRICRPATLHPITLEETE